MAEPGTVEGADFGSTNFEMKEGVARDQATADEQLAAVLTRLAGVLSPSESEALEDVQSKWVAYRDARKEFARRQFNGGSNSTLSAAVAGLVETQRREAELRSDLAERAAL